MKRMWIKSLGGVFAIAFLTVASSAFAATYYVATHGSNANDGSAELSVDRMAYKAAGGMLRSRAATCLTADTTTRG